MNNTKNRLKFRHNSYLRVTILLLLVFVFLRPSHAAWDFFRGGSRVEADPNKTYALKESDGLWFIMVRIPLGPEAKKNANSLVHELRKKYKLEAFLYQFNPNESDLNEVSERNRSFRKYRYQTERDTEYAVLIGSFPAVDDLGLQKTLLDIKRCQPDCLSKDPSSIALTKKFAYLAKKDKEFSGFGPLGGAIAVPNPLIPKEYFNQRGVVDPFLEKLNSDSRYSLLNNERMYTLRVATFNGDSSIQKTTERDKDLSSKLQQGGIKAAALCEALRKKGIEAWEFHDRESSFVTIGGFDSYGNSRPDGFVEINPVINALIEKYRGQIQPNGNGAYSAYTVTVDLKDLSGKKRRMEIPFDLQPLIIAVPQRPENFNRALQAKKRRDSELRRHEIKKIETSLAENDSKRNFSRNDVQQTSSRKASPENQEVLSHNGQYNQPQSNYYQNPAAQPYAQQPYAQQPYAQQPYAQQPYAQQPENPFPNSVESSRYPVRATEPIRTARAPSAPTY